MDIRVGFGYDLHPLVEGRPLLLGGVEIPYHMGLKGHSDADVLLHAITDALFGSLSLGDLGSHFPDTDERWKGADSRNLLSGCYSIILSHGFRLVNLDATVVAEKPKLTPWRDRICESIAGLLDVEVNRVSVKATTNELMGPVGREEAIVAYATVLVRSPGGG
ncbi:MAG: 2-C-methyl-D-erythritol 2,4-cyclodiphosphate synthase [Balneolaceae bacterium]